MIPKNHVLYGIVFAQPNVTCAASVVAHFYSARAEYPLFCYNCGTEDVQPVSNELKQQLYSVHPLCEDCRSKNVHLWYKKKFMNSLISLFRNTEQVLNTCVRTIQLVPCTEKSSKKKNINKEIT